MTARIKDRGLAYFRRSTTKQDNSLPMQLEWARKQAQEHSVRFDGTAADLEHMVDHGLQQYKDTLPGRRRIGINPRSAGL